MKDAGKKRLVNSLARGVRRCRKCRLYRSRKHAVPGEGSVTSGIFFVGEAPGKNEDEQGRPFVGLSGKFLDKLLEKAGLSRNEIFVTGSVKCRPPNNRAPKNDELKICRENWLSRQIEIIEPELIVLLGRVALKQLLGEEENLEKIHGQVRQSNGRKCLITFHPAAAMRFPKVRKKMEGDIAKVSKITRHKATQSHSSTSE
jgi:uracil-DNA glycosylase family 4